MSRLVSGLVILFLLAALLYLWFNPRRSGFGAAETHVSHTIVVEKITAMGKMELSKYHFQDLVNYHQQIDWWPDPRVTLVVYGEAVGCVDFSGVSAANLHEEGDSLLIVDLPLPEICYTKIDHERTRVQDTRFTTLYQNIASDKNHIAEAYKIAEVQLRQTALDEGILDNTRQQAEMTLRPMLEALTKRKVMLRFPVELPQDGG